MSDTVPDPATGGTLRDAIAEAVHRHFFYTTGKADAMDESFADAVLVALKEHLAEHPAALSELGFRQHGPVWMNRVLLEPPCRPLKT